MSGEGGIIRADKLSVGYGTKTVVENVDFHIEKGQMLCLIGPNGAGKSTLLRTVSGLLRPVSGTVYVDGEDVRLIRKSRLAKKMAVVLTEKFSAGLLTVFEVAAMGRHPYTGFFGRFRESDRELVHEALKSVGAGDLAARYFNELSDGERQKVMIARALAQQPRIMVLDEPTSHLDIRHRVEVVNILSELCRQRGLTVMLALHDIDLALKGCEYVMMLKGGKVQAQGRPEAISGKGAVQELYEIQNARYDELLGSLELSLERKRSVFIVGGGGGGIPLYRALHRAGAGMSGGVLHENDCEAHVAEAICGRIVKEKAFEPIGEKAYEEALGLMLERQIVIDTGFEVGVINRANVALIMSALDRGKTVYSLRDREEAGSVFGSRAENIKYFNGIDALAEAVAANLR